MAGKEAKVNSVDRIVDANLNISEFDHRPNQIRQWFTNNIIRPMFAYMVGWTGTKAVMLRATRAGILKTAPSGTGIEHYEVNDATEGIGYLAIAGVGTITLVFEGITSVIDVYARLHEIYVEIDNGSGTFDDAIIVRGDLNQSMSVDMTATRVRLSNVDTGGAADGEVQIVTWR